MTRKKKLALNTTSSMVYQIVTILCSFILPHYFLVYYGSSVNGLVTSITQFMGFVTLCELGMGSVVQSALYGSLAERDFVKISQIYVSAGKFFRRIAQILVAYVLILAIVFPLMKHGSFGVGYIVVLIIAISISSFAQYYFGITNQILLSADQRSYIQLLTQVVILITNTTACIVLIKFGASIQVVSLSTSLIFLLRPIVFTYYVKRHYAIDKKVVITEEPIKQKWNGIAQHFATVVLTNSPVVVLTVFSTFSNISVYSVYYLVAHGVTQIIVSLTNGMQALLGNMFVLKEEKLEQVFSSYEWALHSLTALTFSVTAILIVPFVEIYTKGIHDVNYTLPTAALIMTLGQAVYCLRTPYQMMVFAAGHYKQTQRYSITEAVMNVVISVALVTRFGISGVAIGMLVAVLYRTTNFAWYLSKNILFRKFSYFIKHLMVDCLIVLIAIFSTKFIHLGSLNYFSWLIMAIKVGLICLAEAVPINALLYRKEIKMTITILFKNKKKQS